MDIHNLAQRREAPGAQRQPNGDPSQQSAAQFTGTLDQVEGQETGSGPDMADESAQQQTSSSEETHASEQERLRAERLAKFGSYTGYSLWRRVPAMAMGIVAPSPGDAGRSRNIAAGQPSAGGQRIAGPVRIRGGGSAADRECPFGCVG